MVFLPKKGIERVLIEPCFQHHEQSMYNPKQVSWKLMLINYIGTALSDTDTDIGSPVYMLTENLDRNHNYFNPVFSPCYDTHA